MSENANEIKKRLKKILCVEGGINTAELEKMKVIILNRKVIDEKKTEIINALKEDKDSEFYQRMVSVISNPAGVLRGRYISDGQSVQNICDIAIMFNKILLFGGIILILLFFINLWFVIAGLICWLLSYFVINKIQTIVNIELTARLFVYDQLFNSLEEAYILEIQY